MATASSRIPSSSQAARLSSRCIPSGVASPAASARVQPFLAASGLPERLAALIRIRVRFAGTQVTVPMLAEPASTLALDLTGVPVRLTST